MSIMPLSGKRQTVLPAELCCQASLAPGTRILVELASDGSGILVHPATNAGHKPASVLFGRVRHSGKPVAEEELQGLAAARKLASGGKP